MKTKITLSSLVVGAVLFSGCATSSVSIDTALQKAQEKGGGLKEFIVQKNKDNFYGVKIYADKEKATILRTREFNANGFSVADIYEVTNQLSSYCKSIKGKWTYGKPYGDLLKRYGSVYVNPIIALSAVSQQTEAEESNYNGFGKCDAGDNSFKVDYELGRFNGAVGDNYWNRFYKVTFNKPQKTTDYYITRSNHYLLSKDDDFKSWDSFVKKAKKINPIFTFKRSADFLTDSYIMCLNYGGKMYVSNKVTNYKKTNFNDFVFKQLDLLHKEYPKGTDGNNNINELSLFATQGKKDYIWCENSANPKYQFTLTSTKDKYGWIYYNFKPNIDKNITK